MITSPAFSVSTVVTNSMISGTPYSRSLVTCSWTTSPLMRPMSLSADGSRPETMNGPSGVNVSDDLALHQERSLACQLRALTSFPHVKPST